MRTASVIDDRLTQILSEGPPVHVPLAQLTAQNNTQGQLAMAIAGGYRSRFAFPAGVGAGSDREGIRFGTIDLRGGAVYSREMWNPAGGVGLHISPRVGADVALYSNSANIERKRNPSVAVSLRLNR